MKPYLSILVLLNTASLFGAEPSKKPNILLFIVDEQRQPTTYESKELKEWKKQNLIFQEKLASMGSVFLNHYTNTTACSPSRTTIHTGQYPNVHGVTQTDGIAKLAEGPLMKWLPPFVVPTMGNYLRADGYRTILKGKWHLSDASIRLQNNSFLTPYDAQGSRIPDLYSFYLSKNVLDDYGYEGWVGPEPHGRAPLNSGSSVPFPQKGRDVKFTEEILETLDALEKEKEPWFLIASYVDPHDITVYGLYTNIQDTAGSGWAFNEDPTLPEHLFTVEFQLSQRENLVTKPQAQLDYRNLYASALQPIPNIERYQRYYYTLQKRVDQNMNRVLEKLIKSPMYENTIILFTSDHGDLLSSHGGMFQKWYQAYEEAIHVPLIISSPLLGNQHRDITAITAHVDLLPTVLELAKTPSEKIRHELSKKFSLALPPSGHSMVPLLTNTGAWTREEIYFYTEDDPTRGVDQIDNACEHYDSVVEPNSVEAVVAYIGKDLWKLTHYYSTMSSCVSTKGVIYELYNVTEDPMELRSLYNHPPAKDHQDKLLELLHNYRAKYRTVQ